LSEDSHRLTVYQLFYPTEDPKDEDVVSSVNAHFWIDIPIPTEVPELKSPWSSPPPEPFPILWIIAVIATVLVVGSGILSYFRKRKQL